MQHKREGRKGLEGKDGLSLLGDVPLVAETPEELLDDETTPIARFFVRNNGLLPQPVTDVDGWTFTVDGEVERPLTLSLADLKSRFPQKTFRMVLECGGNGRSFFEPKAEGNPWTNGGVGCAEWTGVSLGDVLREAGLKETALFTGHFGADPDKTGSFEQQAMSRGVPIAKALEEHTLLVWAMNGEALPFLHGGPLRLIVPGWPGSLSQKWLKRIWIRDREHDGPGMTGLSYRLPVRPLAPGADGTDVEIRILESMPVRSIVTAPADGSHYPVGTRRIEVRGAAWAGDDDVARVEVTLDGGATWIEATMAGPRNRYDWARWQASLTLPGEGYYEIFARATDSQGRAQPFRAANWNPNGYGCNVMHRVVVKVGPAA
ncbi:DMSO/TMAO reductase YedYZ molybdopterin-dependent catalytic subunit [Microvirga lupini]|uniref:DMSO/TMAO reductase YedYZ molybdopterin-dependent catalytic subunit n=1 Tax=Microvirga lupini TaxID=420324 RepID=A0A7W4YY58_9HYPH|nr:sulfite oxidase [Microvirga lupini]MBB3021200.1 DMSO/TMAO reductase YedYZ molybdopterin-dependent catalytic subunit [Microvirga lupini]